MITQLKTHTLISRTQNMIIDGIDPSEILLITFTNKAANEMKERIKSKIGDSGDNITVGTFHSICNRILRKYAKYINYNNNFTILSEDDKIKIISKICKRYNVEKELLNTFISNCKNKTILPNQALVNANNSNETILANMYKEYQDELFRQQAMDFDDLLINTIILLENNTEVKSKINNNWKYITVDESADCSKTDVRLIVLLAGTDENVCMVSDPDQSIYAFRGSEIEASLGIRNILKKETKIFNLSRNYRSSITVVEASKSLIAKNPVLLPKKIRPARDYKGTPIIMTKCATPLDEAAKVVSYITMMKKKHNIAYKDMFVLYRMNFQSRVVEQALLKAKIPCRIHGGVNFFNRAEVQDILSFIRLTINEYDVSAFKRSIQIPKRGIGEKTIEKIDEFARDYPTGPIPIKQAISEVDLKSKSGKHTKASLALEEYKDFISLLEQKKLELEPSEFIKYIITELEYVDYLNNVVKENVQERIENLMELVNAAKEYEDIEDLITQASLYSADSKEEVKDQVTLMSMHASKGLESRVVIMVGLVEGTLPSYRATSPKQVEEERRLAYVGMTRAMDYLFMLYPQQVMNQGRLVYAKQSRFLEEIDVKYVYKN